MKILNIQSKETHEIRTDGRYPSRIGSTVEFYRKPIIGTPMMLSYILNNQGKPKTGYLVTSKIVDIEETVDDIIVVTANSVYYLEK